jgi:hypothetical protein
VDQAYLDKLLKSGVDEAQLVLDERVVITVDLGMLLSSSNSFLGKIDEVSAVASMCTFTESGELTAKSISYKRRRVTNSKNLDEFMQTRTRDMVDNFKEEMEILSSNSSRTLDTDEYSNVSAMWDPGGPGDRILRGGTHRQAQKGQSQEV